MKSLTFFLGMVVVVALLLTGAPTMTSAQRCNIQNLAPCLPAVTTLVLPTAACCQRLAQQKSCFCGYLKNPIFKRYYNKAVANKISAACRIPIPKCP